MYGDIDKLINLSPLTEHDYEYLKGNKEFWPCWGAALGVVMEWNRNHGYGDFGKPTESGLKAMRRYEEKGK